MSATGRCSSGAPSGRSAWPSPSASPPSRGCSSTSSAAGGVRATSSKRPSSGRAARRSRSR
eukprot:2008580-Alexandrium_andersonii.AAC.1